MNRIERSVSLHPYFKIHDGQMNSVKALLREFVARAATEDQVLYYEFTLNGDIVYCREAYTSAAAVLAHVANVGAQLDRMLTLTDLLRLEVHGPAAELEQLKEPMGKLNPSWFVYECGVER